MSRLTRRTQVLLDEDRYSRLERRAGETNRSIGALVRDAIDVAFPERGPTREDAFEFLRNAQLADHGSPEDVKREIASGYDRSEA
jgi:hypothetical protein